ncbi:flavodoxin [Blastopirellula marina]|uniref:Flavodoxin n=1 Tax=Blastopirellula marina TaxID=124 RepID=A0A2S8FHP0_9BACT|nr:flavodoxin [Blastopirellula marina]PQO31653.1 flavodoxin [Blastopirellula marina]PTL42960.1 flavodoxin [Blastopirellula marina]
MLMAIFYGSTTGNTESAANKMKELLADCIAEVVDVHRAKPEDLLKYDLLLFGVSTWNIGEVQDDWAAFLPKLKTLDLSGKKVAFFGMGDSVGYPDNYLDAMGELWETIGKLGTPQLVGVWPIDGYEFDESRALYDDNHFIGLGLDDDNQWDLTEERIANWLAQVVQEAGIVESA